MAVGQKSKVKLLNVIASDAARALGLILLALGIILTAFGIVYSTNKARSLVNTHEQLRQDADDLEIEWRNLRLELSALADHGRIETIAMQQLKMSKISLSREIVIKKYER